MDFLLMLRERLFICALECASITTKRIDAAMAIQMRVEGLPNGSGEIASVAFVLPNALMNILNVDTEVSFKRKPSSTASAQKGV